MAIKRTIEQSIRQLMDKYPIIAVTGPRQSGKTTLLKMIFNDYEYISLEDPDVREFAETDPRGFLKQYDSHVIFDEIQQVPHLFSYMQNTVDSSTQMGRFIISGSQNFHLMQNITQSLAGRVAIFRLFPFDFDELQRVEWAEKDYLSQIIKGFYPAIYHRNIPPLDYYPNYIDTYVKRDVSELIAIKNMSLFQQFLSLLATRAGQLLNFNSLANECGISQPTAKSWFSALESSYIVFLLHPYHENFSKRITKTPKLYFYDTGLLSYLLGINDSSQLINQSVKGALFENMIIADYYKKIAHYNKRQINMWFWRDSEGNEVDLLIQKSGKTEVIEMKSTETVTNDLFKGLNYYASLVKDPNLAKKLIYAGNKSELRSEVEIIPWSEISLE